MHTRYSIKDFSLAQSELTFILESPHTKEILLGYPAAGETGRIISKVIFNEETPIGKLLQDNKALPQTTSILNACSFPLQNIYNANTSICNDLINIIAARNEKINHIPTAKERFKESLNNSIGQQIITDFRNRFKKHLNDNKQSKFIICGLIAQCIFEEATGVSGWFHEVCIRLYDGIKFSVFYENHPAADTRDSTSKWLEHKNIKPMLDYIS